MFYRRKGAAIVETKKGILLVSTDGKRFMLPGGGAKIFESRKKAAIRELYEETGLRAKSIHYLFGYMSNKWRSRKGKIVRNNTKVFVVKATGFPKPRNEINHICFWTLGSKINLTSGAKMSIEKYLEKKSKF